MSGVLAAFAVLLGLPVLLLAVPLRVAFELERVETFRGALTLHWLFGLVRIRIRVPGAGATPREPEAIRARRRPARRSRRANLMAVLGQAAFRQRVYRLIRDLYGAMHLRRLRLRVRLGLGDPADTGRLWALVGPLHAAARCLRHAEVMIEPEFVEPVFEFRAQGRLLLVPLQFLVLAIGFALSPASMRAWRSLRGAHA